MVGTEMLRADDDLVQVALKQLRDHVSVRLLVKEFMNNHRMLTEIKAHRRNEPRLPPLDSLRRVVYTTPDESR